MATAPLPPPPFILAQDGSRLLRFEAPVEVLEARAAGEVAAVLARAAMSF